MWKEKSFIPMGQLSKFKVFRLQLARFGYSKTGAESNTKALWNVEFLHKILSANFRSENNKSKIRTWCSAL
jgi:hypothetical protein